MRLSQRGNRSFWHYLHSDKRPINKADVSVNMFIWADTTGVCAYLYPADKSVKQCVIAL